jgi:uncharacterized phage-associated protein
MVFGPIKPLFILIFAHVSFLNSKANRCLGGAFEGWCKGFMIQALLKSRKDKGKIIILSRSDKHWNMLGGWVCF